MIKDNSISSFPEDPTCGNENFSENVAVKICSCLDDHVQGLKIEIPVNVYRVPASGAKRAFKKEVKAGFLWTILAKDTTVVLEVHSLSS